MTAPDEHTAASENFVGAFRVLVRHVSQARERLEAPGCYAFVTGLPFGLFNGVVVTGPTSADELRESVSWVASFGVPYRAWIDEARAPGLDAAVLGHGLRRHAVPYPAMVMAPLRAAPAPPPDVELDRVTDHTAYETHVASHVQNGVPASHVRTLFPPSLAHDPDVALFTATTGGSAVGQSIAIRTDQTVGVYAVGVVPEARGRGIGTAMTWAAVDAGRAWGCRAATLQASEMGLPIYRAMGFAIAVPFAEYRLPPPP